MSGYSRLMGALAAIGVRSLGRPSAASRLLSDANMVLPGIFELIRYDEFKRALCFLDPHKILGALSCII